MKQVKINVGVRPTNQVLTKHTHQDIKIYLVIVNIKIVQIGQLSYFIRENSNVITRGEQKVDEHFESHMCKIVLPTYLCLLTRRNYYEK